MKTIVIFLISVYQRISFIPREISKTVLGTTHNCIYTPTCSEYMVAAVKKYGVVKGVTIGLQRIGRCRPGKVGGVDTI
jgi:putative membrane protein insertion efficiency factor